MKQDELNVSQINLLDAHNEIMRIIKERNINPANFAFLGNVLVFEAAIISKIKNNSQTRIEIDKIIEDVNEQYNLSIKHHDSILSFLNHPGLVIGAGDANENTEH